MKYELILFDCDGVLVDSEPITCRVFAEHVTRAGWPMDAAGAVEAFRGLHISQSVARIEAEIGAPLPSNFVSDMRAEAYEALRREVRPVAGVIDVLRELAARDVETCVASQAPIEKMKVTLGATGIIDLVEGRIFSAAMVPNPKPAPDLFLYASGRFGSEPRHCAVVEDSVSGVRAAVAAGMDVYGYAAEDPEGKLAAAGATAFHDMADLIGLMERASESA